MRLMNLSGFYIGVTEMMAVSTPANLIADMLASVTCAYIDECL